MLTSPSIPFAPVRLAVLALCLGAALCQAEPAPQPSNELLDERTRFALMLKELDNLDQMIRAGQKTQSQLAVQWQRYSFDYTRMAKDVERIRLGITQYLMPRRAQPRDPVELTGFYTRETGK